VLGGAILPVLVGAILPVLGGAILVLGGAILPVLVVRYGLCWVMRCALLLVFECFKAHKTTLAIFGKSAWHPMLRSFGASPQFC
jgi:hypothetical protein